MIAKIIGLIWVIWGVIVLVKPEALRKKLQIKGSKKLKKSLFLLILFFSFTLIIAALKADGILFKVLIVLGLLGLFKAFIFLKSKVSDKLIELSSKLSLAIYRAAGAIYIVIGLSLMKLL